jgi:hypothetical protein
MKSQMNVKSIAIVALDDEQGYSEAIDAGYVTYACTDRDFIMVIPKNDQEFVNLTPHEINVVDESGEGVIDIPASGEIARVETTREIAGKAGNVPVYRTVYGEITGLPAPREGIVYVVSGMVLAQTDRIDVMAPGELVRDDAGKPIGCVGLAGNLTPDICEACGRSQVNPDGTRARQGHDCYWCGSN